MQIVAQIVSMQCLFYLSYGLLILVFIGPYETLSVDFIFNWRYMELNSWTGIAVAGTYFLNAILGAVFLLLVVERSYKSLDFTVSQYFLHVLARIEELQPYMTATDFSSILWQA